MRGATASSSAIRSTARHFNPRSSCEERLTSYYSQTIATYFNPRSSCEERPKEVAGEGVCTDFNPRSSCEERPCSRHARIHRADISIHAPHARSDVGSIDLPTIRRPFQSTLLMRGATNLDEKSHVAFIISIHAPHARSDIFSPSA